MRPRNLSCILLAAAMLMSLAACGETVESKTTPAPSADTGTQTEYRLTAEFIPAGTLSVTLAAQLKETAVISFTNTSSDTWERICLRDYAASNLELENAEGGDYTPGSIHGVKDADGKELEFDVQEDKSVVYVTLSAPLKPGERTSVTVAYSTEIPCGGQRLNWAPAVGEDHGGESVVCLSQAYPMLAEYIDGKWNETPYFTDGECFYSRCGSYEMTLSIPDKYTVVSTGSETKNADGTWTLRADNVRDFAVIAGSSFGKLTAKAGDVTVNSYYSSNNEANKKQGEMSLRAAVDAVKAFEEAWGRCPYDELDVVEARYNHGGMEYPGMVRITDRFADSLFGGVDVDDTIYLDVAHEVAHQWFYAAVGNDQYREAWLDESFAVLGEYVYVLYTGLDNEEGVGESLLFYEGKLPEKYIDLSYDEYGNDNDEGIGGNYVLAVYRTGPEFLWKLRQAMGAESFDSFMHTWYEEHMFKEVTTADFRAAIEKTSPDDSVKALLNEYLSPVQ